MRRERFALVCMLFLAACSIQPPRPWEGGAYNGEARAAFSTCPADGLPYLCAEVVPRVGLFNHLLYRSASAKVEGGWDYSNTKRGFDNERAYAQHLPARLGEAFDRIGEWEMLTTKEDDAGYASRQINLSMRGVPADATCSFRVRYRQTEPAQPPAWADLPSAKGLCGRTAYRLATNREAQVCASTGDAVDCFSGPNWRAESTVVIPEDVLIISLGDSFAAGEGNPDASRSRNSSARWMDERCNRSAWAGPVRAGLALMRESVETSAKRESPMRASGGITVVSVACSGATITSGLVGDYEGANSLSSLAARHRLVETQFDKNLEILESAEKLRPQITQVVTLLSRQPAERAKRSIDTLLVSVGGNDALFAKLIELFIRKNVSTDDLKPYGDFMNKRLRAVRESYGQLQSSIAGPQPGVELANTLPVAPDHVLITEYPSPALKRDGDGYAYCDGVDGGAITSLMGVFGLTINERKFPIIDQCVVNPLNRTVRNAADLNNWYFVEGVSAGFAGHGFCAGGTAGDAYASQDRWFRSVDDTMNYQGNVNGLFHPTWQGHEVYTGRLYAAIKAGRDAQVRLQIEKNFLWKDPDSGATYAGREATIARDYDPALINKATDPAASIRTPLPDCESVAPSLRAAQNTFGMRVVRVGQSADMYCPPGVPCKLASLFAASGHSDVRIEARHPDTRRMFRKVYSNLFVDLDSPQTECRRVSVAGGADSRVLHCREEDWILEGQLKVSAPDPQPGSGTASCTWKLDSGESRACEEVVTELPEGPFSLLVEASDRVNNPSRKTYALKADNLDPVLGSYTVFGHRADVRKEDTLVVPLMRLSAQSPYVRYAFEISATDSASGPSSFFIKTASIDKNVYFSSGCDSKRSAAGALPDEANVWRTAGPIEMGKIVVADCAGRTTKHDFTAVLLGSDGVLQSVRQWRQQVISDTDPAVQRVGALSRRFSNLAKVSEEEWALYAAWLNLAEGSVSPLAMVSFSLKDCVPAESAAPVTAYAFLRAAEACAAQYATDKDKIAGLGEALIAAKLLSPIGN